MIVMTIKLGNGGFMNDDSAMDLQKEARKRERENHKERDEDNIKFVRKNGYKQV
jgi:hypothetical protein